MADAMLMREAGPGPTISPRRKTTPSRGSLDRRPLYPRPAADSPNRLPSRGARTRASHPSPASARSPPSPVRLGAAAAATKTAAASSSSSPKDWSNEYLIPPPRPQDVGKMVVVLDLDETLIFSRGNLVSVRPGVGQLLQTLKGNCELIVWTSGTRDYALDVIKVIDPFSAIQHCIYRHPMWWNGSFGCPKDLRLLGRPMERTLLIDNTPEVLRLHPSNCIIVSDYYGSAADKVIFTLNELFQHTLFKSATTPTLSVTVPTTTAEVLSNRRVVPRVVRVEDGTRVELRALRGDSWATISMQSPLSASK